MKIDYRTARMRTHRRNIQRYGRLLATELTDLERQYLHKRIAEEQAEVERLAREGDPGSQAPAAIPNRRKKKFASLTTSRPSKQSPALRVRGSADCIECTLGGRVRALNAPSAAAFRFGENVRAACVEARRKPISQ